MAEQSALDIQFSKRFSTNLISNIVYFILNLIIGLALAPFFLDTLGQSAYGLIPLATSVTSYVTLVIDSVNGSVSRFLTVDLQKGDIAEANKTFNTALFGTLAIILILAPIALVISFFAPSFFNIGTQTYTDVFLLFALVFASVLIRAWSSNFMVTLFANNRLDYRNYVNITNTIVQVGLVILLFTLFEPSLPFVGASYLVSALVAFAIAYLMSRKVCPYLIIQKRDFVWARFKDVGDVALWMGFNILGGLLYSQIGLMIVNKYFGEIAGTDYSLALMWFTILVSISSLITNMFTPMIYAYFAKDDSVGLLKFTSIAIKSTGLLIVLLVGLIYLFVPYILTLWIGADYVSLVPIICILLLAIPCFVQNQCVFPIYNVYKKVRLPAVANFISGGINLTLALTLPLIPGVGIYGVAIAYVVSQILLTGLFDPIYSARVICTKWYTYVKYMVASVGILGIFLGIGSLVCNSFFYPAISMLEDSFGYMGIFLGTVLSGGIIAVAYLIIVIKFILQREDKMFIITCVPKPFKKLIPEWLLN